MSLRARIFIIVSILVLFVLGISIFLIVRNKNNKPETTVPTNNTTQNGSQSGTQTQVGSQAPNGLTAKTATPLETEKNGAVQLAKVFVERYGTYSTDNNFENIKEVKTFVTPALWSKISASMDAKNSTQSFVGVTTKVISLELTDWSDTAATIELKTMRTEEKNGAVGVRYQNATVEMVKIDGVWLVDKLVWN